MRSPTNGGRTWKFEYMIFLNSPLFDIMLITGIPHVCTSLRKGFQDKRDYKRGKRNHQYHPNGLKPYVSTYFIQWYKLYLATCLEIKFPFTFLKFYINNNNNNLFIYSALFNMLGDQKRITTINNLKTIQILEVYKYI